MELIGVGTTLQGPTTLPGKSQSGYASFLFDGEMQTAWVVCGTLLLWCAMNGWSHFLGRRLRALGLRFPRQCSLSDFFDLPAATGFGHQKKSSPTVCERCCAEPNHTGFSPLPFHFVELDLLWGDHQEIRRVDPLVRNAESDGFIRPIRDRTCLFRCLQMLRVLGFPRTPVAQRAYCRFRHTY